MGRKIDPVQYILSLLIDCHLKYINDKKLIHKDFKKAKEMYKDRKTGTVSKEVLKQTLLMEIDENKLLEFLTLDDTPGTSNMAIEEVKELIGEEEETFDEIQSTPSSIKMIYSGSKKNSKHDENHSLHLNHRAGKAHRDQLIQNNIITQGKTISN